MAMDKKKLAAVVALAVPGVYFLIFHYPPLPLNHVAVGLGTNHLAHSIVGLAILAGAGFLWFKGRKG